MRWLSRFFYNKRVGGRNGISRIEGYRVVGAKVTGLFQNDRKEIDFSFICFFYRVNMNNDSRRIFTVTIVVR